MKKIGIVVFVLQSFVAAMEKKPSMQAVTYYTVKDVMLNNIQQLSPDLSKILEKVDKPEVQLSENTVKIFRQAGMLDDKDQIVEPAHFPLWLLIKYHKDIK